MTDRGSAFPAEEIIAAYAAFHRRVEEFVGRGDWTGYADLFTEDAVYEEHAYGTLRGRDEIRDWAVRTMTTFPGSVMTGFPLAWQVVDEPTGRLICEVRNLMPDPGDGSRLEESNLTIMTYAGDGLFSREEDVYNPLRFVRMAARWARIARSHDRLDGDGAAYLERYGAMAAEATP